MLVPIRGITGYESFEVPGGIMYSYYCNDSAGVLGRVAVGQISSARIPGSGAV